MKKLTVIVKPANREDVIDIMESCAVEPRLAIGAEMPIPMKLKKASVKMTFGTRKVICTMIGPNAIFTEAFLSFIGISISAPMASWGSMAQDARQVLTMHPGQLLLPTICICITIFSLNFLGEGIGDAFNPKKTRG